MRSEIRVFGWRASEPIRAQGSASCSHWGISAATARSLQVLTHLTTTNTVCLLINEVAPTRVNAQLLVSVPEIAIVLVLVQRKEQSHYPTMHQRFLSQTISCGATSSECG